MNFPLILDIALGLIFIYLILSLLASEIQELLTTLLQWRATHLKKSIEILLTAGEGSVEEERVKQIVNELYNNPLIKNINQEAKEGIEAVFRKVIWQIGKAYRTLRGKETTSFGKGNRSAPSYIPSETFSTTLLERLNIKKVTDKLVELNLKKLQKTEIQLEIQTSLSTLIEEKNKLGEEIPSYLQAEVEKLERKFERILDNFQEGKAPLETTIQRLQCELEKYIGICINYTKQKSSIDEEFIKSLNYLKEEIFYKPSDLLQRLTPSLTEIVGLLDKNSKIYQEIQKGITNTDSPLHANYKEIEAEIRIVIDKLPESLKKSLSALARRSQIKVDSVDQELSQFKKEIEIWFDRSMDRASGVYKRNAKGVAFLIGLVLAFAANADTFHIVNRLSKDTPLRYAITQNAGQITSSCSSSQGTQESTSQLDCIRQEVNQTLDKISLPLGWSTVNLSQQEEEGKGWQLNGFSFASLRRILGWMVSGLAISMGAPFWFELLGKIINVRNTGPKPASSAEKESSAT
ncbi:MAG TPA: hypothetical protein V6D30_18065 [Leptolyngbyaceae cyanobacterium]